VLRRVLRSLRLAYLTVDPRSLGLFRIGFGLVLLADLFRRYEQLDFWYTNAGLLPNHTLLWRPPAGHMFSFFFAASSRTEAALGFGFCAVVYGLFTLGYRTRVMQVAALICRVSLNSRLAVLENGGDMVVNLLGIFTLALPLGRRFSLDAWLHGLRDDRICSLESLNGSSTPELERRPVVSIAMLGLILQFAAIYFFNAISKQGDAWTGGQAVHYALHQDKFVTSLGVLMRDHLPGSAFQLLTWSTLAMEWTGFALVLAPVFIQQTRLIAFVALPLMHLSFALGLNLGAFSPAMMSFFPLLLTRAHWDALGRWLERRTLAVVVDLDQADVLLLRRARIVRELDRFGRITWNPSASSGWQVGERPSLSPSAARQALLSALPWGFAVVWLLRAPGLALLLSQAAAGFVRWSAAHTASEQNSAGTIREANRPRLLRWVSDAAVALLMLAIVTELVNDNTSVPLWMRVAQPRWAKAVIEYPRLLQGWRMFAPDPPMTDSMIYVEATTSEGLRVDPYNAVASRHEYPAGDVVPERLDQSQFFTMYSDRIASPGYAAYRQAFTEWLLAYPERTGRAADCLTAFDVYLVTDRSPRPGSRAHPTPISRERFLQYSASADSGCRSRSARATTHAATRPAR
jgi:hypothetical protein